MDSTSRSQLHVSIYKYFQFMAESLESRKHKNKAEECQIVLQALKALLPEVAQNINIPREHIHRNENCQNELTDLEIRYIEHPMLEQRVAYLEFQEQKKGKYTTTVRDHARKQNGLISSPTDITVDEISELLDERTGRSSIEENDANHHHSDCDGCTADHGRSGTSEAVEKKENARERAKRKAIEMKKHQQEAKRQRELEYYKSVDVHELISAPPHAREYTGTEWLCTARQRYQQYRCKGGKCKSSTRVRTYCSCSPTRWLCQQCFISHIRAEIV